MDWLFDELLVRRVLPLDSVAAFARGEVLCGGETKQRLEGLPHLARDLCVPELQYLVHA